jgi:hypothetical protein
VSVGSFLSWGASRVTAGCEAQGEAEGLPFHPGVTGEGKAGRVNVSESSYAPLSAAPRGGWVQRGIGLAAGKRQAPTGEAVLVGEDTAVPGVQRAVRHEVAGGEWAMRWRFD